SEVTVDHCTFYDSRTGLALYEKTSGQGGGRAVVSNSIFAGRFDLEAETLNQSDVHFSYCLSEKSLLPGEGNLKGEAQFVDPLHGNFNLLLDSPCIDAGDPSAPLDPDGTRSDIGAYAYHFGPALTEGLVINEVMADNTSTLADEAGEFDDWIELYNGGNEPIDIAGLYLTDDPANPTKHRIAVDRPEQTTIPAKGFLLLWADGQPEQGACHLNFKLSARGEKVALVKINRTSVSFVDSVTFASMAKDASWGRFPDGDGEWRLQYKPTPAAANQAFPAAVSAAQASLPDHFALHPAFPNPFNSQTVVQCELPQPGQLTVEVFNVLGQRIALLLKEKRDAGVHRLVWDGRNEQGEQVPSGVYYLRATMGEQVAYVKMALIR
ncbi:MAG: lamin tail domain-containing protein, partial [candidate division KSB1 bacterium]|nr:lamin tail domain-containing protein [candidate division KSB1 bacterium]